MKPRLALALCAVAIPGVFFATPSAVGADAEPAAAPAAAADEYSRRASVLAKSAPLLTAAEHAKQRYALGLWARERHMLPEANEQFRAAVEADPAHEPAHAALGDVKLGERWIPCEEAMNAKGLVLRGDRWVLREEAEILDLPAKDRAHRTEQKTKVDKLLETYAKGTPLQRRLAADSLATVDDRHKLEPFAYALRSPSRDVRLLAAGELGRLANRRALRPLVRRALFDQDEAVRVASVAAAKQIGDTNLAAPFVKALGSQTPEVRMHAAQALGEIGDVRGVRYIVYRLEAYGGGSGRNYSFFGNQLSYIQDFDVEVAQTAFIADPQVGTVQEGVSLDVQIVGTQVIQEWVEREVMYTSLRRLTGATDVKNDPGAWAAWWRENGQQLEASAAK